MAKLLKNGDSLLQKGNTDAAFAAYSESLTLDPCSLPALSTLGKISYDQTRYFTAVQYYTRAIKCHPGNLSNFTHRAYSHYHVKEDKEAKRDAMFVLKHDSLNSDAFHILGLIATNRKDFKAAMTFYNRAIGLNRQLPKYYDSRATLNYKLKNWADAKRDLDMALALDDSDPEIYADAAMVALGMGEPSEAMGKIQTALDMSPVNPTFLNIRGFILLSINQLPEASANIKKSMEISPYNADTYRNLGIYLYLVGQHDRSVKALEHSAMLDPNLEKIHFFLGVSYLKAGRTDLACEQFRLSEKNRDEMVTQDLLTLCPAKK